MGFYGNITNTSRTQFQFDRTYPNRSVMEKGMASDGIYMGRYVLVDYDQSKRESYRTFYLKNGKFYLLSGQESDKIEVKSGKVQKDELVRAITDWVINETEKNNKPYYIYKCTGFDADGIAQFTKISGTQSVYTTNYEIDIDEYGAGRGWDSTVWQKVFTEGAAKYVMIAELNSVVPSFEVVEDAPTMTPLPPHFDQASNNVHYKMHYQPQWGLRVRSADAKDSTNTEVVPSDENVIWKRHSYDVPTDIETVTESTEKGAIYYNKAGFNPEVISYDGRENKISIEPTGYSGYEYNVHNSKNPAEKARANDIQEISVILPSIGNTISDVWDLMYGNKTQNEGTKRNLDIAWDSTEGLRMVKRLEDENNDPNGFTYDTSKINTVAGAINSVHDLMGMIIIDVDDNTDVNTLNADNIFYKNKKYYRKAIDYDYTKIENNNFTYEFKKVNNPTSANYQPNTYYLDGAGATKDLDKTFNSSSTYYERYLNAKPFGTEASGLIQYEPLKFFYKELNDDYILDQDIKRNEDKAYLNVTFKDITIDTDYESNVYYIKNGNNYNKAIAENPISGIDYYKVESKMVTNKPYKPDTYYYYEKIGEQEVFKKDTGETPLEGRTYYEAEVKSLGDRVIQTPIEDETGKIIGYVEVTIPVYEIIFQKEIVLFDISEGYYYMDGQDFIYTTTPVENKNYYTLEISAPINSFYIKNQFYYKYNSNTWRIDTSDKVTKDRQYMLVDTETPVTLFYEPGKYYYLNAANEYEIDKAENMTAGRTYFTGEDFYVFDDVKGTFAKYSLWNNNVKVVPCTVELSRRTEKYHLEELVGFARGLNTIHGLILEINKFLEFNDQKTRELDVVQGCINKLNDIIYKFDQLTPKEFLVVDNYGRAHSADFSTLQNETSTSIKPGIDETTLLKGVDSDKFEEVGSVSAMRKQWLTVNIDGNVKNPFIKVHHNFQKVADTTSATNKNSDNVRSNSNNDKIQLYTPIVDDMGHVVGENTETVTLPYGFKTIITNGRSEDVAENAIGTPSKPNVVAENTQDILAINSGNKWIRIDTNASEDTLTISHDVHNTSSSSHTTDWTTTEENTTIPVPTYSYDEAGHYKSHHTESYKLPFAYGKIKGDSGETAATATFDELTFGSDKWLTATIEKDKVVYSHDYPEEKEDTFSDLNVNDKVDNEIVDTIILETLERDATGHVIKVNQNTVTLPFGYKVFEDSNSTKGSSVASNTQDTFVFKGDNWIKPTVTNDLLTLEHTGPIGTAPAAKNAVEPVFGATFDIEDWSFDDKGHKNGMTVHTVKIPQPSINTLIASNAAVVTNLTLEPTAGKFNITTTNVGDLILTGYTAPTTGGKFDASNSINVAFRNLQDQVIEEIDNRKNAISDEVTNRNNAISSAVDGIRGTNTEDTITSLKTAITTETENREQAIEDTISALKGNNTEDSFETLRGSITTETENREQAIKDIQGEDFVSGTTLASLLSKINDLTKRYDDLLEKHNDLEKRIIALEPPVEEPLPEEGEATE